MGSVMRKRLLTDSILFGPSVFTEAHGRFFEFLGRTNSSHYDRIMDAFYADTHIGGGMHRTFDGSHTFRGSWESIARQTGGVDLSEYLKAHLNELVTPEGVPLMTLDKATYEKVSAEVSEALGDVVTAGQVGDFIRDMNSVNAGEVLCAGIGSLFMFAAIRTHDPRAISRVVGANLCLGIGTGNPLQLMVALGGLTYGVWTGKIQAWELLKGSAPAMAGLLGYALAEHALDLANAESVLLGLVAGVGASALLAHLDRRRCEEVMDELGDDPRYVAVMTPGLLRQELRLLQHRRPSLSLGI
jgi:hypothetical protein